MTRILEEYESIKTAFDKYSSTLQKINERRGLWTNETKARINDTLKVIMDSFKFDWEVQILEGIKNYQTINISFNAKNSGIVDVKVDEVNGIEKGFKAYIKQGGYLAFCQSYSGKINIIIGFPYIKELTSQTEGKVIDTIEPEVVTEELISKYVIKFLETMTEWEGKERESIGYK